MARRRLLLFKWLIVLTPPVTVILGYILLGHPLGHSLLGVRVGRLGENLVVAFLLLALAYISAELLFRRLQRLQAEAQAHQQDVRTMNAVMQERARLSRELHDGAAQLVAHLMLRLDTIKELVEQFEERHQIPTSLRADRAADQLSPLAALQVFRLIQEALSNVRRHAAAREASVSLTFDGMDQLSVMIAGDGQGLDPGGLRNRKARPLGLTSMRERV